MSVYQNKRLQNEAEFDLFLGILRRHSVSSYLEIGSKFGGSLWRVADVLPKGSRIVSVDLPHGTGSEPHLRECIQALNKRGFDAQLYIGDSTDPAIVDQVSDLGPYDCVFIDANHTLPYVRKDWANYGPMAKMVAFHDISWVTRGDRTGKLPIDVPAFWNEIKTNYRHEEIRLEPRDNGIGVLWR